MTFAAQAMGGMMPKFRKKPVVVEAFHMTAEHVRDNRDWPEWLHRAWNSGIDEAGAMYWDSSSGRNFIVTLEGHHAVTEGDWIIRGVRGELYPCKPDIFDATYDPVVGGNR